MRSSTRALEDHATRREALPVHRSSEALEGTIGVQERLLWMEPLQPITEQHLSL
jgi:hypothetical protein